MIPRNLAIVCHLLLKGSALSLLPIHAFPPSLAAAAPHGYASPSRIRRSVLPVPDALAARAARGRPPPFGLAVRGGSSAAGQSSDGGSVVSLLRSAVPGLAAAYAAAVSSRPILVKSLTAGSIFFLSEVAAQIISNAGEPQDGARNLSSFILGSCYFGPAAHYWYDLMFHIFPGSTWISILQKAALGQLVFGPIFTVIFFAAALAREEGRLSPTALVKKVRSDFMGVWTAGVGYWSFVDLLSYKFVPVNFIPLFVNFASFCWTVYLSLVANQAANEASV